MDRYGTVRQTGWTCNDNDGNYYPSKYLGNNVIKKSFFFSFIGLAVH